MFKIVYSKNAVKDVKKVKSYGLTDNLKKLLDVIRNSPYQVPPPYEKLIGDFQGAYSRRINIQHRLVYQVFAEEKVIKILSLWTHYER